MKPRIVELLPALLIGALLMALGTTAETATPIQSMVLTPAR